MKRKIIQISASAGDESTTASCYALADDGSFWEGYNERFELTPVTYKQNDAGRQTILKHATYEYRFVWHPLPALPADTGNLTKDAAGNFGDPYNRGGL